MEINTLETIKKVSTAGPYTTFLSESGKIYSSGWDDRGGLGLGLNIKNSN